MDIRGYLAIIAYLLLVVSWTTGGMAVGWIGGQVEGRDLDLLRRSCLGERRAIQLAVISGLLGALVSPAIVRQFAHPYLMSGG